MAKKSKKAKKASLADLQYEYICPACSDIAIESSNKMLEVQIVCKSCEKLITLDDEKRYKKLKKNKKRE